MWIGVCGQPWHDCGVADGGHVRVLTCFDLFLSYDVCEKDLQLLRVREREGGREILLFT